MFGAVGVDVAEGWDAPWFIAGLQLPTGQVSYHLPLDYWYQLDGIPTHDRAPEWDGHTPADVPVRLLAWQP